MQKVVGQERDGAEYDTRFRREVQIGIEAAEAGDVMEADAIEADAAAWRVEVRRRLPDAAP
ncbi:hypothetical protein [Methylobacterium oryzihabitans]|uniref:Uncharacterized protein n=1 Tax=Methylobacterium oryzihabitans TaxID=2499852 RepID=A0A437NVL5_9HYPH|nr:hypothetical protein [Methylobacterium oryzihabitans]RVU14051.1 hypothetical protein EOE48_24755 [Methylobacterium oryzihabitans]